jgi:branched-chain amino acid transport system substrate-binding protein
MRTPFCTGLLLLAAVGFRRGASAQEVVKVAFIEVLSDRSRRPAKVAEAAREVVTQLNAKSAPTDPKFEVVPFDGKGSPQESASALKSASDRGIRYITQGGGSGVAFALVEAINRMAEREPDKATVYLNYSAMDPGLTNDRCSFWHFRFYPSSEMKIEALTTYLKGRADVKKVYLLNQNYTHGQQVSKASREYLGRKRPDVQIVGDDFVPIAQTRDFAPYIAKIAASGADTVITSNWGSDLTLAVQGRARLRPEHQLLHDEREQPGHAGADGPVGRREGRRDLELGSQRRDAELEKTYVEYKKKYNEDFIFAAHWNSMNMLLAAMRQAKSTDPKKVATPRGHELQEPDRRGADAQDRPPAAGAALPRHLGQAGHERRQVRRREHRLRLPLRGRLGLVRELAADLVPDEAAVLTICTALRPGS